MRMIEVSCNIIRIKQKSLWVFKDYGVQALTTLNIGGGDEKEGIAKASEEVPAREPSEVSSLLPGELGRDLQGDVGHV